MTARPGALAQVETALTKYFVWSAIGLVLLPLAAFTMVVTLTPVSLEVANKYVDSAVKMLVGLVGAAWALNRYFVNRADALQVRLESHATLVPQDSGAKPGRDALLLYRIDINNTGRVLFQDYEVEVEIASVELDPEGRRPRYYVIDEMPLHAGGPIEPGSWAAVSGAVAAADNLRAVRLLARIETASGRSWTRHEILRVGDQSAGPQ